MTTTAFPVISATKALLVDDLHDHYLPVYSSEERTLVFQDGVVMRVAESQNTRVPLEIMSDSDVENAAIELIRFATARTKPTPINEAVKLILESDNEPQSIVKVSDEEQYLVPERELLGRVVRSGDKTGLFIHNIGAIVRLEVLETSRTHPEIVHLLAESIFRVPKVPDVENRDVRGERADLIKIG